MSFPGSNTYPTSNFINVTQCQPPGPKPPMLFRFISQTTPPKTSVYCTSFLTALPITPLSPSRPISHFTPSPNCTTTNHTHYRLQHSSCLHASTPYVAARPNLQFQLQFQQLLLHTSFSFYITSRTPKHRTPPLTSHLTASFIVFNKRLTDLFLQLRKLVL